MVNLLPLKFRPGFVKNLTDYANTGGWFDGSWVRFRDGLPEKMGGWAQQISTAFLGICRSMYYWSVLNGATYVGLGTHIKYYVATDAGTFTDVTPIRRTVTLGADPFSTTNGVAAVVVTDVGHGATDGSYVTFSGATGGFAGLAAGDLNKEFVITYLTVDTYSIVMSPVPNATATGGGAAVSAAYQINIGYASNYQVLGWGTGAWGRGTWGSDSTGAAALLRLWSQDNFGEDLFTNVRNAGLYLWDATSPTARMLALSSLGGASNPPTVATLVLVSAEERHAIAFGANPIGSGTQDTLFVRWSDSEDITNWTPAITNTAGGYRLSVGTKILSALKTRSEILIFTDQAVYSMRWTGSPYVFSFTLVGMNISTIAPNGAVATNDFIMWMGRDQFFLYDGRIVAIDCPVSDYVFRRINYMQLDKVYAYTNSFFNEVGWLYASDSGGGECDSYVIYNYKERAWYTGSVSRTAWLDRGPAVNPLATSTDSYLYVHEFGFDDGSTNPPTAITSYIESSPLEMPEGGLGGSFMFINRFIPDITFRNSSAPAPAADMTLEVRNYPGALVSQSDTGAVVQSVTVPVTQFTDQCFTRLRGRSVTFRCESTALGVTWRLGMPRIDYRPDGRR